MINVNVYEVNETYNMIEHEKLGARTITLGISLPECMDSSLEALNEKIYKKITTLAKNLVSTDQDIEVDFGTPIVNRCISVVPIALVGGSACRCSEDFVTITKTLNIAAREVDVNFIDGYSTPVSRSMTRTDKNLILSIPQTLSQTERVCSSADVGPTKAGIDMDAVELVGKIATETAEVIGGHDSLGYAKLVMFCNIPNDNSFMVGVFHGVAEFEAIINVGVNGPGIMKVAPAKVRDANFKVLCEAIKETVFKIIRVGQLVTQEASRRMGIPFGTIDLSLTPTPSVGDSVAEILEETRLERVGVPGTTAALAMLNDQVKKGGVMVSSYVDGLSDAFIPVSEGQGMIDAINMGAFAVEKLEVMTCVCLVDLDAIVIPGDTLSSTVAGTIADKAAIGVVNQRTTAVRLTSVVGKEIGETVEFDGLLGYAPVMPANTFSYGRFVTRGRRTPVPIHSFKN